MSNPYATNKLPERERVVFEIHPDAIRRFDELAAAFGHRSRADALRGAVLHAIERWSNARMPDSGDER
jgi:hypothetical protein